MDICTGVVRSRRGPQGSPSTAYVMLIRCPPMKSINVEIPNTEFSRDQRFWPCSTRAIAAFRGRILRSIRAGSVSTRASTGFCFRVDDLASASRQISTRTRLTDPIECKSPPIVIKRLSIRPFALVRHIHLIARCETESRKILQMGTTS